METIDYILLGLNSLLLLTPLLLLPLLGRWSYIGYFTYRHELLHSVAYGCLMANAVVYIVQESNIALGVFTAICGVFDLWGRYLGGWKRLLRWYEGKPEDT